MRLALAVMLLVVAVLAAAHAQWRPPLPAPTSRTPAGPATLSSDWIGSNTLEGFGPRVLVGIEVTVGAGGRAGLVRFRVQERPGATVHEGGWVELPARPGTYTFPAPPVPWDYRDGVLGLEQKTGSHAIVAAYPCCPNEQKLTIGTRVLPTKLLTLKGISERDFDRDLASDESEDRTDLGTSARVRRAGGRVYGSVTVRNAGRRAADLPDLVLRLSPPVGLVHWAQACEPREWISTPQSQHCPFAALKPGEQRTLRFDAPDEGPMQIAARATSEGADLTPADNGVSAFSSGPEPELALHAAPSAETLTVSATRPGTVFVTLTTPGRTWCARALPFARPGKMTLPVPMLDGIVTASALSTSSSAEVRIQ